MSVTYIIFKNLFKIEYKKEESTLNITIFNSLFIKRTQTKQYDSKQS